MSAGSPGQSDLLFVLDDDGALAFVQAVCEPCTFRGTVYPVKFAALAVAMANRHDGVFHNDYSGYREGQPST